MGGAYLTLLNTIANLGYTLPKFFLFAGGAFLCCCWEGRVLVPFVGGLVVLRAWG